MSEVCAPPAGVCGATDFSTAGVPEVVPPLASGVDGGGAVSCISGGGHQTVSSWLSTCFSGILSPSFGMGAATSALGGSSAMRFAGASSSFLMVYVCLNSDGLDCPLQKQQYVTMQQTITQVAKLPTIKPWKKLFIEAQQAVVFVLAVHNDQCVVGGIGVITFLFHACGFWAQTTCYVA